MLIPHRSIRSYPLFTIWDMRYQPFRHFDKHMDGAPRISIIVRGQVKEDATGKEEFAKSGSIVFKPGDLVHKNTFGDGGSRILSVIFKEAFFDQKEDVKIKDWQWFHGISAASTAFEFARNLEHISGEEELYEELIDLLAKLPGNKISSSKDIPQWLVLVKTKIKEDYKSPIRTKDLAQGVGVHPVYLARAFRRYFGHSVKAFLHKTRLEHALSDLSEGSKPLSQIALDAGFSDQSHLNRVFRSSLNMSPGNFRKWTLD